MRAGAGANHTAALAGRAAARCAAAGGHYDPAGVEVTGYDCVDYKYLPQGSQSSGGNGVSLAMMDAPNVENRISSTETYLYADHDTVCSLLTVCEPCQFESASGPARGR